MKHSTTLCSKILAAALLVSGLIFGAGASVADQTPCSGDIEKFCPDLKPGKQALMECLEQHETQLSDACKEYEAKIENPRAESREVWMQQMRVRQTCKDDITKFCNDIRLGSTGTTTCLTEHTSELSIPCRDAVQAVRGGGEERTTN